MHIIKKALVFVLGVSTLIELYLAAGALFQPEKMMTEFGITVLNDDVLYMACIVGWFCLIVTAIAGLAAFWVYRDKPEGLHLSMILGLFWVGIGLQLGFEFARPQHLALDAAKGALIVVLTILCCRELCTKSQGS